MSFKSALLSGVMTTASRTILLSDAIAPSHSASNAIKGPIVFFMVPSLRCRTKGGKTAYAGFSLRYQPCRALDELVLCRLLSLREADAGCTQERQSTRNPDIPA